MSGRNYHFGGALIESAIPLPDILPAVVRDARPALRVRYRTAADDQPDWRRAPTARMLANPAILQSRRRVSGDGAWLFVRHDYRDQHLEFDIASGGGEVRVAASDNVPESDIAAYLEGAVLGGALRLSGRLCLHGSVLTRAGRAIALIGESGAGKSSLACAMIAAGCRLLSDDVTALVQREGAIVAHPGRARVRIWADTAARLVPQDARLAPLFPQIEHQRKLSWHDPGATTREPTPLAAIFRVLPRDAALTMPKIAPMTPPEALRALAGNLYGEIVPEGAVRRAELAGIGALAATMPVRNLTLPDDLEALATQADGLRDQLFA